MNAIIPTTEQVGARVAALLADSPSGVMSMPEIVEMVQRFEGGTIDANRKRVRRAIDTCRDLTLVELTSRRGDWDVMLPDGQIFMPAWIVQGHDAEKNRTVWRFVFERTQAGRGGGGYGSGRTTWLTTRPTMAAAVDARKQTIAQERQAEQAKRAEEAAARWATARERDAEYVQLLQRLDQVPGVEVRTVPTVHAPGMYAMFEVSPEAAGAFKTLLRRMFADSPADVADAAVDAETTADPR